MSNLRPAGHIYSNIFGALCEVFATFSAVFVAFLQPFLSLSFNILVAFFYDGYQTSLLTFLELYVDKTVRSKKAFIRHAITQSKIFDFFIEIKACQ